jgi:DNA processing protein
MTKIQYDHLIAYLTLYLCPRLGCVTIDKISQFLAIPLYEIPSLSRNELSQLGVTTKQISALHNPDSQKIQKTLDYLQHNPATTVLMQHEVTYPERLLMCHGAPLCIFVEGDPKLLHAPQIAIVGSRFASDYGKKHARDIAAELAKSHWVVTSGLAQGIDAQAHRGTLDYIGATIAVLGHGLGNMYPKFHAQLRQQIVSAGGTIVSEFLPFEGAQPAHFPKRNRIISGLTLGTLVVEAKAKSGSLITAQQALQENRDVFALPGYAGSEAAQGCHALIKDGAILVEYAADILSHYPPLQKSRKHPTSDVENEHIAPINKLKVKTNPDNGQVYLANPDLLDSVGFEVTELEKIVAKTELTLPTVLAKLLEFELSGYINAVPGGYIRIK